MGVCLWPMWVCLWPMFVYSMRDGYRVSWLHGGMFVAYVCVHSIELAGCSLPQYKRWLIPMYTNIGHLCLCTTYPYVCVQYATRVCSVAISYCTQDIGYRAKGGMFVAYVCVQYERWL